MNKFSDTSDLSTLSLANHFLIAMPGLNDPNFSHSITYICEHNKDGAMGLVLNHPLPMKLSEVFEQMGCEDKGISGDCELLAGGPVQLERGFVLHSTDKEWDNTAQISEEILLTGSKDIIEAIADGEGPEKYLVFLGYAGWEAGQLEQEIADNAWLTIPADSRVIFETETSMRWKAAAECMGIDINLISQTAGHA
ncbi:YqgE/AlgH family protein [Sessilibacter sp. MAH2]